VCHLTYQNGLNFSLVGRNVLYCSRRYGFDVSDVLTNNTRFLSDTIHSHARSEVTEAQLHEVDLLLECLLIRDGQTALPCWFPRADIQSVVNYISTCDVFFVMCFFVFLFVCFLWSVFSLCEFFFVFSFFFFVYLGTSFIINK